MAVTAGPATTGVAKIGGPHDVLTEDDTRAFVHDQLEAARLDGRSVCVLVPDGTRSCPLPLLVSAIYDVLNGRVSRLAVLVTLGTRAAMNDQALAAHLGYNVGALASRYPSMSVLNHAWWNRSALRRSEPSALTGSPSWPPANAHVRVNRAWSSTTSR